MINPPQAMIMAIGAGEKRPYVVDDALAIATVMSATGSFDHRAIDGADGARADEGVQGAGARIRWGWWLEPTCTRSCQSSMTTDGRIACDRVHARIEEASFRDGVSDGQLA